MVRVPQFGQNTALAGSAKPQFEHAYGAAASTAGCPPVAPANGGVLAVLLMVLLGVLVVRVVAPVFAGVPVFGAAGVPVFEMLPLI